MFGTCAVFRLGHHGAMVEQRYSPQASSLSTQDLLRSSPPTIWIGRKIRTDEGGSDISEELSENPWLRMRPTNTQDESAFTADYEVIDTHTT